MLNPSYSTLINILNEETNVDQRITSRYSVVIAAAKRARQIVGGAEHSAGAVATDKAVSIAVSEIESGNVRVVPGSVGSWHLAHTEHIHQNLPVVIDDSFVSEDILPEGEYDESDDAEADFEEDDDDSWDDDSEPDDEE